MFIKVVSGFAAVLLSLSEAWAAHASSLQRLYIGNEASNSISVVDPSTRTVLTRVPTGPHPHNVNVDPCMEADALYKINIENWKVEKVIPVGKGAHGIAYITLTWEKPKGKLAVVDTVQDTVLYTLEVEEAPNGIALLNGKNQGS